MKRHLVILAVLMLWAARSDAKELKNPDGIVVHISDSTHMTKEECNAWHQAPPRNWDSCGYNFVVEPDGTLYEGRGIATVGAHVQGENSHLLGFCFVSVDKATPEQLETFFNWRKQYDLERLPLYAHNDFNKGKRCGRVVLEQVRAQL